MSKPVTYIIFTIILLHVNQGFAQSISSHNKTSEMVVTRKDATLKVHLLGEKAKVKIEDTLTYYWYKANEIKETQGGYEGKLLHGKYTSFYLSNNLKEKGTFKKGLKNGEWRSWYPDGKLKEVANFSSGKMNGKFRMYDEKGILTLQTSYCKGLLHGDYIIYIAGKESGKKEYCKGVEVAADQHSILKKLKKKIIPVKSDEDEPVKDKPKKPAKKTEKDDPSKT